MQGTFGECGLRGGYVEMHNIHKGAMEELYKMASINLSPNTIGQVVMSIQMNPPKKGDVSPPPPARAPHLGPCPRPRLHPFPLKAHVSANALLMRLLLAIVALRCSPLVDSSDSSVVPVKGLIPSVTTPPWCTW